MFSRLFSLARSLVSWTYFAALTVGFLPVMLLLMPSRRLRVCAFNVFGFLTGRVMATFAGASLPPGVRKRLAAVQPAIFVSNHTSYLDNFLATWATPVGTLGLAQSGTVWVPFFGQLYALSGNVLVDRRDRRAAASALRTMIDLLQAHRLNAMIWPEGGRAGDGRLQPFKRGFVHVALATRLPIVPVVVSDSFRCWPKGSGFTRFARVGIQVLDPISTAEWSAKTIDAHVTEVWTRFAAALPPHQQPAPGVTAESRK
jgi:1-acyl-sn-glycerol-3-phosphate acyltransferase